MHNIYFLTLQRLFNTSSKHSSSWKTWLWNYKKFSFQLISSIAIPSSKNDNNFQREFANTSIDLCRFRQGFGLNVVYNQFLGTFAECGPNHKVVDCPMKKVKLANKFRFICIHINFVYSGWGDLQTVKFQTWDCRL